MSRATVVRRPAVSEAPGLPAPILGMAAASAPMRDFSQPWMDLNDKTVLALERKSVQPIAARAGQISYDQLHHFLTSDAWDAAELEARLLAPARHIGGAGHASAWLAITEAALPKKGAHSVGVAPQYTATLGRRANCQTLVSVALAGGVTATPVAMRLYLPPTWISQPERLEHAGVPANMRTYRDKAAIALAEIDRVCATGVRPGGILIDARFGLSAHLRAGLAARKLPWTICIPSESSDGPGDNAGLLAPTPASPALDITAANAQTLLADATWQTIGWRSANHRRQSALYAAIRVTIADRAAENVWLIGEQRPTGDRRYYLSNLPAKASLKHLCGVSKMRQANEDSLQRLRQDLGLEHFEGRSWIGLHRHCLMTMIAGAFLQSRDAK